MMTIRQQQRGLHLATDGRLLVQSDAAAVALDLDRYELSALRDSIDYMLKREDWFPQ